MKIEVWSDFVCPFCYIGKRRLESALNNFPHNDKVHVEYRSYELDPHAEKNPDKSIHELLANKYGMSLEKAKATNKNLGQQAKEVGLTYNFDDMQHTNTFDAHRIAQYAHYKRKGKEMTERLLHAYFTESKLISDHATLLALSEEVGLDSNEVAEILKTNDYSSQVRFDEEQAKQIGVQGVPFFVFNEKYAVSGAQPVEVFSEVIQKVWEEENKEKVLQSLNPKSSKTSYCTDEGCEIED